ncbi:UPF0280 family protein [Ruegeria sp. Ofav3-42]|uniref:UPF0280 family protein n=1 Tax=Ruegeria sp. Ofav3-42 TaxID=2917759 RepID=UPI001EF50913|nr:UPF0280 family protein [Ruegeria sp. Ofav3-42]MCG7519929.1 UPF0280 family protein [Ruegeria sp. Ofav3-42]
MQPVSAILPCGRRLHLQHGPIDLIVEAEGARDIAFKAAQTRFQTILQDLVDELALLKSAMIPNSPRPRGLVARRMDAAARPHIDVFVTPMAAVAGAVADEILTAMLRAAPLDRASVNNGGDIALYLGPNQTFRIAMSGLDGRDLGRIAVSAADGIGGIATSGRGGRSLSLGIADSVTVLAQNAAMADVAATLIANAVDLPGHPAIRRLPANQLRDDSDLGEMLVPVSVNQLSPKDTQNALLRGLNTAKDMQARGLITAAHLSLGQQSCQTGASRLVTTSTQKVPEYA